MLFTRRFSSPDNCYGDFKFVERTARIAGKNGTLREYPGVVFPEQWDQTAVNIFADKYMRKRGVPEYTVSVPETSVPDWLRRHVPAPNPVTSVYAVRHPGHPAETDCREVFARMAGAWTYHAWQMGYFMCQPEGGPVVKHTDKLLNVAPSDAAEASARAFHDDLLWMLANQYAAPNSPQWFNTGLWWAYGIEGEDCGQWRFVGSTSAEGGFEVIRSRKSYANPGVFACYINSLEDTLLGPMGIMDLATREARIFKAGGGAGCNVSNLRGRGEPLSGGGVSSGVIGFLKGLDSFAGAIKSGGTTRRAAKLVLLDDDHPELSEFCLWKWREEAKVALLLGGPAGTPQAKRWTALNSDWPGRLGLDDMGSGLDGEAYQTVTSQNSNNSVFASDAFMEAAGSDRVWKLRWRTDKEHVKELQARKLFDDVVHAAWACADPGLAFKDRVNDWNPVPGDGPIRGCNPCQPACATVLTPDGVCAFGDIEVGSVIWSGSCWTRVSRKVATGIKPVFRYSTRAGSFVGTACHRVFSGGERVPAGEAESIDQCRGCIPFISEPWDYQAVVDGLVVGDGTLKVCNGGRQRYRLLCVGDGDRDYFQEPGVRDLIDPAPFNRKMHRVETGLSEAEVGAKTYDREVPNRYFRAGPNVARSFLRGLFSANGSVCGGRVTLKATSFAVIDRAQQMLSSLGIRSYHTINKAKEVDFGGGRVYECRQSYDLNVTADRDLFRRLVGFIQTDKSARLDEACSGGSGARKHSYEVVSVEPLGDMPVWDITVEAEEHSYWTGGLLVSNCAEYWFLDDTSCNLASLNLLAFHRAGPDAAAGRFAIDDFRHAVRVWTTVLDVTVGVGGYPSEAIARGGANYRTLGLGYANLGAFLMRSGLAYDSDEGRQVCGSITALMHFNALKTSAELAGELGVYPRFKANRDTQLRVVQNHAAAIVPELDFIFLERRPPKLQRPVRYGGVWDSAVLDAGETCSAVGQHGLRNAQVTLLAPTGTIGLTMGCDTTGIEPDFALVKWKEYAGGGGTSIANRSVLPALRALGYPPEEAGRILLHLEKHGTLEGAVDSEDEAVFDCANRCGDGKRYIAADGHLKMMAAAQPFLSGAISKTVNLPRDATPADVKRVYFMAWDLLLKEVAVYVDGCKHCQPLTSEAPTVPEPPPELAPLTPRPRPAATRERLPGRRPGETWEVVVGGHKLFLRTGHYPDGRLGEIFLDLADANSTLRGVSNTVAILFSVALQHAVPLESLVGALLGMKFEPAGPVQDEAGQIRQATSFVDAFVRWLGINYLGRSDLANVPTNGNGHFAAHDAPGDNGNGHGAPIPVSVPASLVGDSVGSYAAAKLAVPATASARDVAYEVAATRARRRGYLGEPCPGCGSWTLRRAGVCLMCDTCGQTSGC